MKLLDHIFLLFGGACIHRDPREFTFWHLPWSCLCEFKLLLGMVFPFGLICSLSSLLRNFSHVTAVFSPSLALCTRWFSLQTYFPAICCQCCCLSSSLPFHSLFQHLVTLGPFYLTPALSSSRCPLTFQSHKIIFVRILWMHVARIFRSVFDTSVLLCVHIVYTEEPAYWREGNDPGQDFSGSHFSLLKHFTSNRVLIVLALSERKPS